MACNRCTVRTPVGWDHDWGQINYEEYQALHFRGWAVLAEVEDGKSWTDGYPGEKHGGWGVEVDRVRVSRYVLS